MPKKALEENYRRAIAAKWGKYLHLDTVETFDGETPSTFILKSKEPSPELNVNKKIAYENLSEEAKEIIDIVLNSPKEIVEYLLTPKQKRFSLKRIKKYVSLLWNSEYIAEVAIEEVKKWVRQFPS